MKSTGGMWLNKRVVVLSPTPTSPQNFGNRRSFYNFFRRIQGRGARISYLHYPAEFDWRQSLPLEEQQVMQEQWDDYFLIPPNRPLHSTAIGYHHGVDEWWDPGIGRFLDWYFRVSLCDIFIVNYTWLSRALLHAPATVVKILHTHDQFSHRRELLEEHGIQPEFFYMSEEGEKEALQRADVVWAVKEEEERYFRKLSGKPTYTFPHAESRTHLFSTRRSMGEHLVFGLMGARNSINATNYERFLRFLKEYLVTTHLPAEFILAGSICDRIVGRDFPFLRIMGEVDDVAEFYSACDVVIIPMSFSTGLKIKVGEAIGYGKAVIAYRHSFEGYLRSHRYHSLESDREIGEALTAVVNNRAIVSELEEASARSQLDAERRADRCLDVSLAAGSAVTEKVVIPVNGRVLDNELLVDHLCDLTEFIGYQSRPAVVAVGRGGNRLVESLSRLAGFAHCYVSTEIVETLPAPLQTRAREFATVLRNNVLVSGADKVIYLLDWDEPVDDWLTGARAVIHRRGIMAPQDGRGRAVPVGDGDLYGIRNVGAVPSKDGVYRLESEVPFFRNAWAARAFRRLAASGREGFGVIVPSQDVLGRLHDVLSRHVRTSVLQTCIAYLPHADGGRYRDFATRTGGDGLGILTDWLEHEMLPQVVVDLSNGHATDSLLPEMCQRLAIPFLSASSLPAAAIHRDPNGNDNAAGIVTLRLLALLIFPERAQIMAQNLRHTDQFARENGWATLWRLIERLK